MLKGNLLNIIANVGSKITTFAWYDFIVNPIVNFFMRLFYTGYFAIVKAIAWVLDMLTQLFFIFAGMTPVGTTTISSTDGVDGGEDIVNFFLTQKSFQKAYLYLCLIALGLVIVFAIGKIIKQDYFDRTGPRSKGPIFRSVALSFIAFICIIPIFYFLIDAAAMIALLVMRAMGYKGGGIGSLIFNMCWDDNGERIRTFAMNIPDDATGAVTIRIPILDVDNQSDELFYFTSDLQKSRLYDADNFGWYSNDTFYGFYWNHNEATFNNHPNTPEFYWYIYIFTGMALIVNLGQMMLAMVTRMYNLIALFIVAPSPISQIVLDDGVKFKHWKDKVLQEAVKVIGCVMSFMLFIMIVGVVNEIDLMKFAYEPESASHISLIEDNNLTGELSNSINSLYYYQDKAGNISWVDKAVNVLGRCMIVIAGVGAIKDIDATITPFLAGGSSSMDMGNAGKAIVTAGGAAARGALDIGRKGIGTAVDLAGKAVNLGAGVGLSALKGLNKAGASFKSVWKSGMGDKDSDDSKETGTKTAANTTQGTGGTTGAKTPAAASAPAGTGDNNEKNDTQTDTNTNNVNEETKNPVEEKTTNALNGENENDEKNDTRTPSPLQAQEERRDNAKVELDKSAEQLSKAEAAEERRKVLKENEETINNSNLTDEKKAEYLEKLNKEKEEFDASTKDVPSVEEAKKDFETKQALFQMESRAYERQAKEAGVEESPKVDATSGNTPSGENTNDSTSGASDATDTTGASVDETENAVGDATTPSPSSESESDSTSAQTPGDSGASDSESVRFNTLHTREKLNAQGKLAKASKGAVTAALGIAAGTISGVGSAALGITGKTLKAGVGAVGTATKAGLSIAGIVARTTLQMGGMGAVAKVGGEFIGGVASDTGNSIKRTGEGLHKQGRKFVKNGNLKPGTLLGNTAQGVRTAAGKLGEAGGAVGAVPTMAASLLAKGHSKGVDFLLNKTSSTGGKKFVMDSGDKKELNNMTSQGTKAINSGSAIERGTKSSKIIANAESVMNGVNTQRQNVEAMQVLNEGIVGERNEQLDSKVDLMAAERMSEEERNRLEDQRNKQMAAAQVEKSDAENNQARINSHFDSVKKQTKEKEWASGTALALTDYDSSMKEAAQKAGIMSLAKAHEEKYHDSIAAVNAGTATSAQKKEYAKYMEGMTKFDNAYRHVDGDKTDKALASDYKDLESSITGTNEYKQVEGYLKTGKTTTPKNIFHQIHAASKKYETGIKSRAQEAVDRAEEKKQKIKDIPPVETFKEAWDRSTAMDRFNYHAAKFKEAMNDYESASKNGDTNALPDLQENLRATRTALSQSSSELEGHMQKDKDAIITQSEKSAERNEGNARFDKARDTAQAHINDMRENGASGMSVDRAERQLYDIEQKARSSSAKNQYQNRKRQKVKVTATGEMEKFAKKTGKNAAKQAKYSPSNSSNLRQKATMYSNDNGVDYDIEIDLMDSSNYDIEGGINTRELNDFASGYASAFGRNGTKADQDAFVRSVANRSISKAVKEEKFVEAMRNIKKEQMPKEYKGTLNGYKDSVKDEYETAISNYNEYMDQAQQYAREYVNTNDPSKLHQIRDAISKSVAQSELIRNLKIKLEIDE